MSEPDPNSRRLFLKTAVAAAGLAAVASPLRALPLARNLQSAARPVTLSGEDGAILLAARAGLQRVAGKVANHDLVAVVDFARHSRQARFHLVDVASGQRETFLVAHGRGSDPARTGWLQSFSNDPGSDATCEGDFLVGAPYIGKHGRSLRLIGLDPTNSNAEARGIVVHSAWYVGPEIVKSQGMVGRSEGCFALSDADLPRVMDRLGPGHLIVSTKL